MRAIVWYSRQCAIKYLCVSHAHIRISRARTARTHRRERECVCVCVLEGYLLQHSCAHARTFVLWSCYCSTLLCWSDQDSTHPYGRNEGELKRRWKMDRQRFWFFPLLLLIQYEHSPLTKHTVDACLTSRWTPEHAQMIRTSLIKSETGRGRMNEELAQHPRQSLHWNWPSVLFALHSLPLAYLMRRAMLRSVWVWTRCHD